MTTAQFQSFILGWYRANGRHDPRASRRISLPWRQTQNGRASGFSREPYRILVSEVMLQQTQVSRVLRKYPEFLNAFPTIQALARAPLRAVLLGWRGMGYNRRAIYLKRLAEIVVREHGGRIPQDPAILRKLPGIGPGTAGAIAAFAFNRRAVFLETNIRRVFLRFFFPERRRVSDREILAKIAASLPRRNFRRWYYALMDYGATAMNGMENPNRQSAHYVRPAPFAGSRRELRGRILAEVVRRRDIGERELALRIAAGRDRAEFEQALAALAGEGLIARRASRVAIAP